MTGHWKRNCPDFLSKKKTSGMIELLVSEVSFATGVLTPVQLITFLNSYRGSGKP